MTQMRQSRNNGCHCLSMTDWMSFKIDSMFGDSVYGLMVSGLSSDQTLCWTLWPKALTTLTVPLSTQVYKWVSVNLMVRVTL